MTCSDHMEGLILNGDTRKTVTIEKVTNGFIVSSNNSDHKSVAMTKKLANKMASKFLNK